MMMMIEDDDVELKYVWASNAQLQLISPCRCVEVGENLNRDDQEKPPAIGSAQTPFPLWNSWRRGDSNPGRDSPNDQTPYA